jgi:hypothetical protein
MSIDNILPISNVTIKGQVNTSDGAGGSNMTWTTKVSNYKCRIYSAVGMVQITQSGQNVLRTHKCIGEYNSLIVEGDIIINGSDTYRIILNDSVAAQEINHHLEMNLKKENISFG